MNNRFNRNGGYELPGCWIATWHEEIRRRGPTHAAFHLRAVCMRMHQLSAYKAYHGKEGMATPFIGAHAFFI